MALLRVLALGDVVGRPGRDLVAGRLPGLVKARGIHLVIANAENAAAGSGLTPEQFEQLRAAGVGCVTLGDHFARKTELLPVLDRSDRIIRPANLSGKAPGKGATLVPARVEGKDVNVGVVNVSGRLFMASLPGGDPFDAVDRALGSFPNTVKVVVVDMHAEATSEKVALGWHLDGRASLVFGTHTHVATADARVLPRGTGYITDLGMCGPHDGVIGRKKDAVLGWLTRHQPAPFEVATGDPRLNGVLAEIDCDSGRCSAIERVELT
jgi:metallophosphoesterase (TIGR00282 family)